MKAIQISAERQMGVVDIPEMEMKSDEVQLRLEYVGFCGSDLSTYLGKNPMVKMPVVPGHEVGAVIEKVGADVPDGLLRGFAHISVGMMNVPKRSDLCAAHLVQKAL